MRKDIIQCPGENIGGASVSGSCGQQDGRQRDWMTMGMCPGGAWRSLLLFYYSDDSEIRYDEGDKDPRARWGRRGWNFILIHLYTFYHVDDLSEFTVIFLCHFNLLPLLIFIGREEKTC